MKIKKKNKIGYCDNPNLYDISMSQNSVRYYREKFVSKPFNKNFDFSRNGSYHLSTQGYIDMPDFPSESNEVYKIIIPKKI